MLDLWSAKVLVWIARGGREHALTPDAHLFFADRYARLARLHRIRGGHLRASRFEQLAHEHLEASGLDGPPYAAAMAMPRPRRLLVTDAVSRSSMNGPGDAA